MSRAWRLVRLSRNSFIWQQAAVGRLDELQRVEGREFCVRLLASFNCFPRLLYASIGF